MKQISIIAAIDEQYAIGKDNKMLWHLPEDLKRFKRITEGNTVIMGKNTYYSLPNRPLPGRVNIVLTKQSGAQIDNCLMAFSLDEVLSKCNDKKENFVICGASVYRQFFPLAQKLYITKVHSIFEADTFFPVIDPEKWAIVDSEEHQTDDRHPYSFTFQVYMKKILIT
jgi:dihydrofolate reductase